jgi:hypothetical protein
MAGVHLEVLALLDLVGEEEAAEERGGTDDQQAAGEDREDRLVEVVPEPALQVVEEPDARDRGWDATRRHPVDERHVHRLQLQVPPAAGGLGNRRVEDVRTDRRGRLDPEEQDEERRHQGAAAHPGHADQESDAEAEEDDCWIHLRVRGGGDWTKAAFPPCSLS